jgi:drug/metabolite transporter (DMT)-like permease
MRRAVPLAAQVVAVSIWATTFVVSSSALATISPGVLTALRFAVAVALLVPMALRKGGLGRVLRAPVAVVLGTTGVAAYYGLQNVGLQSTAPGTAALLQAVLPVATTVLAIGFLHERPAVAGYAGLALATIGVVLVAAANTTLNWGAVWIVAGVLGYAVYTVLLRRVGAAHPDGNRLVSSLNSSTDPIVLAAATALWGLLLLLPWVLWEVFTGRSALPSSPDAISATLYLGVLASGGTLLLWTFGATRVPASVSGVLTAAIPALGYAFAVGAGEQPTWIRTAGGVLAVSGVLISSIAPARPSSTPPQGTPTRIPGQ